MKAWLVLFACLLPLAAQRPAQSPAPVPATTPDGFTVARPGYRFSFPKDHGSHPDFRTEWWYFTGHLWSADGKRRFGYQLTFFRQASPSAAWTGSAAWRTDQIHLAHGALTDETGRRFRVAERLNRGGLPADAALDRLAVFNEAWSAELGPEGAIILRMKVDDARLELTLQPATPPVVFGEDGVSRKGADPTASSHYITFPRLASTGTLKFGSAPPIPVSGQSWMDHGFSSNQLSAGQVGWDWAAVQLRDGRSLMAYRMRLQDGGQDPFSSITEVDPKGRITRSTRTFAMRAKGQWTSPASRTAYPQPLEVEAWGERWTLVPILADQELRTARSTGITYWEGACRVLDSNGKEVGDAYLELTGYAHSLKGRF
ncbi:MAG: carotenoid 1,2-hydratase [Holophagaceae bacterium]|nr:carotenoid 1,2-hydratase [Holophagaceae bacterium]